MKKTVIHTLTIKLKTKKGYLTDTLWARITHLIEEDKLFTDDGNFESILITGKNNHE